MSNKSKLSPKQIETFRKMQWDKWYSAYDLQVSIATLNALCNMKVVQSKRYQGSYFFPRTNIFFKRTMALRNTITNPPE